MENPREVEVHFVCLGVSSRKVIPRETTKEQVEEMGCREIGAGMALIDFQPPEKDVSCRFKAMFWPRSMGGAQE
jgi:hypothetical protein